MLGTLYSLWACPSQAHASVAPQLPLPRPLCWDARAVRQTSARRARTILPADESDKNLPTCGPQSQRLAHSYNNLRRARSATRRANSRNCGSAPTSAGHCINTVRGNVTLLRAAVAPKTHASHDSARSQEQTRFQWRPAGSAAPRLAQAPSKLEWCDQVPMVRFPLPLGRCASIGTTLPTLRRRASSALVQKNQPPVHTCFQKRTSFCSLFWPNFWCQKMAT